jgi:hypothetical protein
MDTRSEWTERQLALRAIPASEIRPVCASFCRFVLVDRSPLRRVWRCELCLRYLEAIVSREHETEWRAPHPREALPDQATIFELIAEDERRERGWDEPAEAIPAHVKTTRGGLVKP